MDKITLGAIELVSFPQLSLSDVSARIDTGAQTSCLHAKNVCAHTNNGVLYVLFETQHQKQIDVPVHDIRQVKSSNGLREKRYVIQTDMLIGKHQWEIELTLTDRSDMSFDVLIGREAMSERCLVNPAGSYLMTD